MIAVKQNTKLGYEKIGEGGCFNMAYPQSQTRRGRVIDGGNIAPTMDTTNTTAVLEKENPIRVRRLTPRECFRLQGWTDDYFDKAALVNSDSQLYKQAGNGVTVDVIYAIAKEMRTMKEKALALMKEVMQKTVTGGALHIVLDDGNMEDNHIKWCLENSIEEEQDDDMKRLYIETANAFLELSERDRYKVYNEFGEISVEPSMKREE